MQWGGWLICEIASQNLIFSYKNKTHKVEPIHHNRALSCANEMNLMAGCFLNFLQFFFYYDSLGLPWRFLGINVQKQIELNENYRIQ